MIDMFFDAPKPAEASAKVVWFAKFSKPDYRFAEKFLAFDELEILKNAVASSGFEGEAGSSVSTYTPNGRIIAVGLGEKPCETCLEKLGGSLAKMLAKHKSAMILVSDVKDLRLSHSQIARAVALGLELGSYRFDKYITDKKPKDIPALKTVYFKSLNENHGAKGYDAVKATAEAVCFARDLVNEPSNFLTPALYADRIKALGKIPGLKVEILGKKEIEKLKMGALLGVAQGSANEPRVAVLKWTGDAKRKGFDLGLVGKGVTFDTGGYNLKPSNSMEGMQYDMAGSAAVVAAMKAIAARKLKANVAAIVGLVENMISGAATKPFDVLTSMSGKTIEVGNTDAEGRLVLADCMWYAQTKLGVKKIIDIATLTGATSYIFAGKYASLFGNDDKLTAEIKETGLKVGEKYWPMPMDKEFAKMIKSNIADVNNSGKSGAGASTAAHFLEKFVKEGTKWAHLDIAGVDETKEGNELGPKGATGFGTRLFIKLVEGL